MSRLNHNLGYIFYLVSILLMRIPPIYIFKGFLTTHNAALILLTPAILTCVPLIQKCITRNKVVFSLVLLDFFALSLSILPSSDIYLFFNLYKNYTSGILIFFSTILFLSTPLRARWLTSVLLVTAVLNAMFGIYIRINEFLPSFLVEALHEDYVASVAAHLQQGKVFTGTFDEPFMSLFFLFGLVFWKKKPFPLGWVAQGILLGSSILSGFRVNLLMIIGSYLGGFFIVIKTRKAFVKEFVVLALFIMMQLLLFSFFGKNTILRIVDPELIDQMSVSSRFQYWKEALDIGQTNPLLGVGLGQYELYIGSRSRSANFTSSNPYLSSITLYDPHNLLLSRFAQNGLLGLSTLVVLIVYFIKKDSYCLNKYRGEPISYYIVAFWSLFLFALFNPASSLSYLSLFWVLRGIIESPRAARVP